MLEKTDLDAVKKVAKMFVDFDIQETQFSPVVVKHPFTESGVTMVRGEDGQPQMVDLLNDVSSFEKWKQEVKHVIDSEDSAASIFALIVKSYRLAFLKYTKDYLDQRNLSSILSDCWITVEYPNRDPNLSKQEIVALFKKCEPAVVMDKDEIAAYNALPEVITIYRGIIEKKAVNVKGMSWTTKLETARWFAKRFGKCGIVYSATIEKRYVCAYFLRRNEFETVVDPAKLQNVTVYEDLGK